jgi:hypothetical protein
MARPPAHRPCPRTRYRPTSRGEGALAAVTGRVKQTVLAGHRFGSHTATSPATGLDTTLRQPDGPSRGSSSTAAPGRRVCSVASPIRSTSAYGSHSGRHERGAAPRALDNQRGGTELDFTSDSRAIEPPTAPRP